MKSVLFVANYYHPHIGGVEKHVARVSRELQLQGFKIQVLTGRHSKELKKTELVDGVEVIRINTLDKRFFGLLYLWLQMLRHWRFYYQADVVHVHDVFIWCLPLKIVFFWKSVYLTNHGWEGVYPIPLKNVIIKRVSNFLSSGSLSVGKYVDKFYGVCSDFITYGGVNMPKSSYRKSRKKIVYVGRLSKDTGLLTLLEVVKELDGYTVEFYGDGPLKSKCMEYGKVHGFVKDVERHLAEAAICFSSGYLTILEAFANKCLVVTAYENELKRSYYLDTPFKNRIISGYSAGPIVKDILRNVDNKKKVVSAYEWVRGQSWKNIAGIYERLWGLR